MLGREDLRILNAIMFVLHQTDLFGSDRLTPREFNSYGSRRGNDAVMARGTFANIRLFNKFLNKQAPQTVYLPTGETVRLGGVYGLTLKITSVILDLSLLSSLFHSREE